MSGMNRHLISKGKDRSKIKIKGKEKEKERKKDEDDDGSRKARERGRSRRQSAGGGDHSVDMGFKRVTGEDRPSSMSMDRLDSDFAAFTDRASDANDGSITGPADGNGKKAQTGGKQKRASKHRLNFSTSKSAGSGTGNKSRSASTTKITTGASLIPDLNLIINRMRNMPDDSFVYMDYMLPHDSEYFTPYSLREVEYKDLNTYEPFYTVTRHGVTFWHCSENFFTPLDQWQQEFKQFLSIIQIRSFSIFRLWKGFKVSLISWLVIV